MRYQLPDGKIVGVNDSFICSDQVHTRGWLRTASEQDLTDRGITVLEDPSPVNVDHRFYFQSGDSEPTPRPVEQIRPMFIQMIKDQAGGIILSAYPAWKQSNMNMRATSLVLQLTMNGEWTTEESEDAAALQAAEAWILSVRSHSDALEDEVNNLGFEDLVTWQPYGWPSAPE